MAQYYMQYSFSTRGEENMEILRAVRTQLAEMKGKPLSQVYRRFGLVDINRSESGDILMKVDIIHTSKTNGKTYAFFVLKTLTNNTPHTELWKNIGKQLKPHIRVDVIGNSSDGEKYCQPLYVPNELVIPGVD